MFLMDLIKEYSESDIKYLSNFLKESRLNCSYESGAKEKELKRGQLKIKQIGPFNKNGLSYEDRYSGNIWFHGIETISNNKGAIWCRIYDGEITNEHYMNKLSSEFIYGGLRRALREFPKDKPLIRGPEEFVIDFGEDDVFHSHHKILYGDFGIGDFSYFNRFERIDDLIDGLQVDGNIINDIYHLNYFGGFLSVPQVKEAYDKNTRLLAA